MFGQVVKNRPLPAQTLGAPGRIRTCGFLRYGLTPLSNRVDATLRARNRPGAPDEGPRQLQRGTPWLHDRSFCRLTASRAIGVTGSGWSGILAVLCRPPACRAGYSAGTQENLHRFSSANIPNSVSCGDVAQSTEHESVNAQMGRPCTRSRRVGQGFRIPLAPPYLSRSGHSFWIRL